MPTDLTISEDIDGTSGDDVPPGLTEAKIPAPRPEQMTPKTMPSGRNAGDRPSKPRLAALDGLRLIAATMVVFYHWVGGRARIGNFGTTEVSAWGRSAAHQFPHIYRFASFGWTGVELFFMISGFVICMSGWGRRPADFFVSRVVRLVPAYWTGIVLTSAVLIAFPRLTGGVHLSTVMANLTMSQTAYNVPNIDPAYWSLFVELKFYLIFGLVAIGGVTYRRMVTLCVGWSVASIAGVESHNSLLNTIADPGYSAYFVAGIAFYLIHRFGGNLLLWAIVVFSWLLSFREPHSNPPWEVTVLFTSFFVVMALIATRRFDRIHWRWLTVAGAVTYPLYLIHQVVGFTVFTYLRSSVPAPVLLVSTYVGMLVGAWLIHRLVERPVAPRLRAELTKAVNTVRSSGAATVKALGGS
jgi:peptidoglycan/LPS O-acetylase OafA/YrhL